MQDIENALRVELRDPEYSEGYAESFLNSYVATQIKVIREQRKMTQAELGRYIGTTQAGVSRYENVNYSAWSIKTLIKFARAFHVRLKVSFEPFGTLPEEASQFNRESLERVEREEDPGLEDKIVICPLAANQARGGNVVSIDSQKLLAASGSRKDVKNPLQDGLADGGNNQYREQEALCR
jgi:transcriptional regulator with XRE-family HTH domain